MTRTHRCSVATAVLALALLIAPAGVVAPRRAVAQSKPPAARKPPRAAPAANTLLVVQGRIKAVTRPPRPGTMTYPDLVISLHLVGVRAVRGGKLPAAASNSAGLLVHALGVRGRKLTPAGYFKPGQTVTLALQPWDKVEERYGGYNRLDFEDDDVLALPTYWGEAAASPR
jgi:hypothetical protein